MKQFNIPTYYKSPIISQVKAKRKAEDPRKKNFSPTKIKLSNQDVELTILIARHFGFCYGVENAIEIAYKAIHENPDKKIYLLSQMIHNQDVNDDLQSYGIEFIQDTYGNQLIPWEEITADDIVIIPAFGTTLETEAILNKIGVDVHAYNTTCPFVEKVWNRSEKLGNESHTIIIHGKNKHEETRATFSHSSKNAPSIVVKDLEETLILCDFITGKRELNDFYSVFEGKYSENFDVEKHLTKVGVVNQTTMLASETQEITETINKAMEIKFGQENIKNHIADTRDTLCYATNDNQSATYGLMEEQADLAFVIGGYNSSNTTHLVELLETKFPTYFIKSADEIIGKNEINHFDIHKKGMLVSNEIFPSDKNEIQIAITSGASCPDTLVEAVIHKIAFVLGVEINEDSLKF
jgi:4-hydroxy-3-methylbut-2-en-1-yl diphosphate reductase